MLNPAMYLWHRPRLHGSRGEVPWWSRQRGEKRRYLVSRWGWSPDSGIEPFQQTLRRPCETQRRNIQFMYLPGRWRGWLNCVLIGVPWSPRWCWFRFWQQLLSHPRCLWRCLRSRLQQFLSRFWRCRLLVWRLFLNIARRLRRRVLEKSLPRRRLPPRNDATLTSFERMSQNDYDALTECPESDLDPFRTSFYSQPGCFANTWKSAAY